MADEEYKEKIAAELGVDPGVVTIYRHDGKEQIGIAVQSEKGAQAAQEGLSKAGVDNVTVEKTNDGRANHVSGEHSTNIVMIDITGEKKAAFDKVTSGKQDLVQGAVQKGMLQSAADTDSLLHNMQSQTVPAGPDGKPVVLLKNTENLPAHSVSDNGHKTLGRDSYVSEASGIHVVTYQGKEYLAMDLDKAAQLAPGEDAGVRNKTYDDLALIANATGVPADTQPQQAAAQAPATAAPAAPAHPTPHVAVAAGKSQDAPQSDEPPGGTVQVGVISSQTYQMGGGQQQGAAGAKGAAGNSGPSGSQAASAGQSTPGSSGNSSQPGSSEPARTAANNPPMEDAPARSAGGQNGNSTGEPAPAHHKGGHHHHHGHGQGGHHAHAAPAQNGHQFGHLHHLLGGVGHSMRNSGVAYDDPSKTNPDQQAGHGQSQQHGHDNSHKTNPDHAHQNQTHHAAPAAHHAPAASHHSIPHAPVHHGGGSHRR